MGLLGCSSEQVTEGPEATESKEIAFSAGLQEEEAVTRSSTPLEEMLPGEKTFKVWGYKNDDFDSSTGSYTSYQSVIEGYTTRWTTNTAGTTLTNTHDWEYVDVPNQQLIKFWDFDAKAYRFFAVAPASAGSSPGVSGDYFRVTLPADAPTEISDASIAAKLAATPYVSRLWFSTNEMPTYADMQYGRPVVLQFVKPLARVRFMFILPENLQSVSMTDKSFKPSDGSKIARKGTIAVSFPLKGTQKSSTASVVTMDTPTALDAFTVDFDPSDATKLYPLPQDGEGWYTVLPNGTQGSYTLTVNINGEEKRADVPATFMHWQPGYQYTYKFKISDPGGIVIDIVQVAINDWGNRKTAGHSVYNW